MCNKAEAQQYFEKNLTLSKNNKQEKQKDIDLVELNLRENENGNKEVNFIVK